MLKVDLVMYNSPKEPINAKGILIMTIMENLGDSNCMAMTRKIEEQAQVGTKVLHNQMPGRVQEKEQA